MTDYPECEKLGRKAPEMQAIRDFLQWLAQKGIELGVYREAGSNGEPRYIDYITMEPKTRAEFMDQNLRPKSERFIIKNPDYDEWEEGFIPYHKTDEALLHEYFRIDPLKLEEERRAMLARVRGEG